MKQNLGIISIGTYIPDQVRKNDYWSDEIVSKWRSRDQRKKSVVREKEESDGQLTPGMQLSLAAMAELRDDPFAGAVERRIRPDGMRPSEMEAEAAKDALKRAGVSVNDIGLILTTSLGPDTLLVANAPLVHHAIGAPKECIVTGIEGVCNSFMVQMELAQSLLRSGRIKYALLIQSCILPSLMRKEDSFSPWFGEAATAVLVGACDETKGIQALRQFAEGSMYSTMLVGNPDGHWWEGQKAPHVYIADFGVSRKLAMTLPDWGKEAMEKTMAASNVTPDQIDFLATHQGAPWLRRVTQEIIGAKNARSCDTFKWSASVGPANIPLCLAMGEREGLLREGDLVAAWTGGGGVTYSAITLRWGV
jgi:3-oxoacyl-[acyl-carrier-protein] synthase-3